MRILLSALLLCGFLGCGSSDDGGGAGSIGSACTQSGAESAQCVGGAVCGKPSDGTSSLQCLKTCTQQSDCPTDQDCNGVEGSSVKGCRPKSGTSDGGTEGGKK